MNTLLLVLHIMVCLVLILVVLLQRGKGSDMGAALGGGGSNTVFGGRGAGNFLTKLTTAAAAGFMLTSLSLSYMTSQEERLLQFDGAIEQAAEADADQDASAEALEEVQVETGSPDELVEFDPESLGDAPSDE